MTHDEVRAVLKENGFAFVRNGKHEIWKNGIHMFMIPHGQGLHTGYIAKLRSAMRRAKEDRRIK